jgi:DNA-binding transcriptional LysR family regulator
MEWRRIEGFYHTAKLGGFTKAAEVMFLTQPAVSRQVKALEEELDCTLLERIGSRRLRLTSAGEILFRYAESVLTGYEEFREELAELKGLQKGRLRMAAPFTTLYHLFPGPLREYNESFPRVRLTIADCPQSEVVSLVKAGDVDFGVALESLVPADLAFLRWRRVHSVLLTPPDHPLAALKRVTIERIARYPLILPPRSGEHSMRERLDELFRKRGLNPHVIVESSNVELSAQYVEAGLGISFAAMTAERPGMREGDPAFIPLDHYFPPKWIGIVLRRDKIFRPHKQAFLDILFQSAEGGDPEPPQDDSPAPAPETK